MDSPWSRSQAARIAGILRTTVAVMNPLEQTARQGKRDVIVTLCRPLFVSGRYHKPDGASVFTATYFSETRL